VDQVFTAVDLAVAVAAAVWDHRTGVVPRLAAVRIPASTAEARDTQIAITLRLRLVMEDQVVVIIRRR